MLIKIVLIQIFLILFRNQRKREIYNFKYSIYNNLHDGLVGGGQAVYPQTRLKFYLQLYYIHQGPRHTGFLFFLKKRTPFQILKTKLKA